ncbi:MAG: PrgI family protein [bacterium]
MQYQVPQFIEIEDKIFGPFTLKQFIYLAGGGGVCLAAFTLLPFFFALLAATPFVVLALIFAFYTVNDRPFIVAVEHAFRFFISKKLYIWKQRVSTVEPTARPSPAPESRVMDVPHVTESKLRDLAWSLNIKDRSDVGTSKTIPTVFEI